jgi:UDP-3-O-[3-hydroxymyristoyl] glucosamine N-acyltransferase
MKSAEEVARHIGAQLQGDGSVSIRGIANPEEAAGEDLIFADSERQFARARASRAICIVAAPGCSLPGKTLLLVENPKLGFAKAASFLLAKESFSGGIHPTALVAKSARMDSNVSVGPFVVIEEDVVIEAGTRVDARCVIGRGVQVGRQCRLYPGVVLYPQVRLGHRVMIHSGTVVGSDGFGYVFGEGRHWKFPQAGGVEIGDDVEIGSNCTIDRGSLGVTRIGNGCKLDNLVHVAHNVTIGEHALIAAQAGISGSCRIGSHVMIGGQAGLGEHCQIGDRAALGGQAGILSGKRIAPGQTVWGTPARSLEQFKKQFAWFTRLPEIGERLRKLESSESEVDS